MRRLLQRVDAEWWLVFSNGVGQSRPPLSGFRWTQRRFVSGETGSEPKAQQDWLIARRGRIGHRIGLLGGCVGEYCIFVASTGGVQTTSAMRWG